VKGWEKFLHHAAVAAVGLSGVVYGVMKYFLTGTDADSRVGHPWQQPALKAHVMAAPFLVFALGLVFSSHALKRFRTGEPDGRVSGAGMLWLVAPLVLSGYLVQVLTGDAARRWTGWLHAALGVVYVFGYLAHLLKKRSAAGRDAI
jgi:membrane associated rhomboid family serine protease